MIEPVWLTNARADLGRSETLGPNDSPWLRKIWASLSGSWLIGQPWCGGAVAWWMQQAAVPYPKAYYRARAWLDWGVRVPRPIVGAVVVYDRGRGQGHVGLAVGRTIDGHILTIGGNQGNAVTIAPFDSKRLLGVRWPTAHVADWAWHLDSYLPLMASTGPVSRNEA